MPEPLVFNIQKFSVHDGPGIRTTLFFKGCPIRCAWCHNPESHAYGQEEMPNNDGKLEVVGKPYSLPQLVRECEKDIIFYEQSGGGVTISGGEALAQDMDYIEGLARDLRRKGITLVVDTCGVVPYENYARILPYTDLFLYDLKFLDSGLHKKYTGTPNEQVLDNLIRLSRDGARINLRLIMLDGLNAEVADLDAIVKWLRDNKVRIESVNLLPYHDYGRDKYRRLGREYDHEAFRKPSDAKMKELKAFMEELGYRTAIGGSEVNKVS
ncbi:glycyl-radical enzyme activating protein [Desulfovibrio sp. OttesenSCG-928-C06]|nr:glycyl-radical enzyme activating protein [Desulfovibrio sp. OttesenSCG-928-C06]